MTRTWFVALLSAGIGLGVGALMLRGTRHETPAAASPSARKPLFYRDPMNPGVTSPVPKKAPDGMDYVPVYGDGDAGHEGNGSAAVRIDPAMVQSAGVTVERVEKHPLQRVIRAVGQLAYDERRLLDINAKYAGWVDRLYVNYTGQRVTRGQPLMSVYSPELVSTAQEYLLAVRHRARLAASPLSELRDGAEELVRGARERLRLMDIPVSSLRELERSGTVPRTLTVYAPRSGVVTEKQVVQGTQIVQGAPLFKLADPESLWVLADVYQHELPWIHLGDEAEVELSYLPGETAHGRVTYIAPALSPETRTVKVRVELSPLHTGSTPLRPDMFATVLLRGGTPVPVVAVPEQAVIRTGARAIAVIALGSGRFEPREVRLGRAAEGWIEVRDGLLAGDQIVTSSQFLIDSESNLRAAVSAMSPPAAKPVTPPQPAPEARRNDATPSEHASHSTGAQAEHQHQHERQ